ncbi:hypothetical protein EVAR_34176_1 [Eumeta japonica]|uniref:Uncharacterized protein n=1 Tax=Eumeta variegata TaxID=151549 RepID=A0A4C1WH05_EUMVA|nr:hypothetical protein EVAR_34176_1 [Eumeta japonica]
MPRITAFSLRSSPRAYVKLDFEVHEIFIETAESLNVWAVNFNAVVGGADGFTVVYPQTGAVCGYLRKLAPLRKKWWRQFRPRRCGGLGTRPRSGFGGHRLREAETGFRVTQPRRYS